MKSFESAVQEVTAKRLQKRLWVVTARLSKPKDSLLQYLDGHYDFVLRLEDEGVLFAAGPFLENDGTNTGNGMLIMRAESQQEVMNILQGDPFFTHKLRQYEVKPWQINVGQCQLKVNFSDQSGDII